MRLKTSIISFAIAGLALSVAHATPIAPASYDMSNGEVGSFTYWDDSYDGSGSTTTSLAPLSGGLGDLTDGVIATQNWFDTPGLYVGWATINPMISFNFGGTVAIDSVTLHVDDANGTGGVSTPGSVTIDGTNYAIADPAGAAPFAVTISGLGFTGSTLDIQLFEGTGTWVFVSEIEFAGESVVSTPEPGSLALLGIGLGLFVLRRRTA